MSSPPLQRADGCSVIFSLIVATILVLSFFFVRQCFTSEDIAPVDARKQEERRKKVAAYRFEEGNFTATIDAAHAEMNSSLEEVMQATVNRYATSPETNATDANSTEARGGSE